MTSVKAAYDVYSLRLKVRIKYAVKGIYFCRFELENMSIYEFLPALDLTQSVHAKISIGGGKFPEYP